MTMEEFLHGEFCNGRYNLQVFNHKTGGTKPADISIIQEHYVHFEKYLKFVRPKANPTADTFLVNSVGKKLTSASREMARINDVYCMTATANIVRRSIQTAAAPLATSLRESVCDSISHSEATDKRVYRVENAERIAEHGWIIDCLAKPDVEISTIVKNRQKMKRMKTLKRCMKHKKTVNHHLFSWTPAQRKLLKVIPCDSNAIFPTNASELMTKKTGIQLSKQMKKNLRDSWSYHQTVTRGKEVTDL